MLRQRREADGARVIRGGTHRPRCPSAVWMMMLAALLAAPTGAQETYHLAVDVPSTLGGTDYTPDQIVLSESASYSLDEQLPAGTALSALHLRADGAWLFAPGHPLNLGGTDYEPRDLVAWDGVGYSLVFQGSAEGVPDYARIDAAFIDAAGLLVLSFDVPVALGGSDYGPSDLVSHDGGFALYWDGDAQGVPASVNLAGAAQHPDGTLVMSFDIPASLDASDYLPGALVAWDTGAFSTRFEDLSWPPSSQLRGFSFDPPSGAVPDGWKYAGAPLLVSKAGGDDLLLRWSASCLAGDTDYEIYEGQIGAFDGHEPRFCSTGGLRTQALAPKGGDTFYLVVPRNGIREGAYGLRSDTTERLPNGKACLPQAIGTCSP